MYVKFAKNSCDSEGLNYVRVGSFKNDLMVEEIKTRITLNYKKECLMV